jgi:hypothetical protein
MSIRMSMTRRCAHSKHENKLKLMKLMYGFVREIMNCGRKDTDGKVSSTLDRHKNRGRRR